MKHVEPLAVEQLADLAEVTRREREGAHRPVHREAEPDPDAQDVALGRPLRAVTGGHDPHVVAAQPEVLVEMPDVLRDPTRLGVDVRADEADLHRSVPRVVPAPRSAVSNRGGRWRPPG